MHALICIRRGSTQMMMLYLNMVCKDILIQADSAGKFIYWSPNL